MIRAYQFRVNPTSKQYDRLFEMRRDFCDLYNAALQERRDAWRDRRVSVSMKDQSAQLPDIREDEQYGRWSATSEQQILRRLNHAFSAFFRRVKAGQTPGYPRFKSLRHFDTIPLRHGDGAKLTVNGDTVRLYVQGVGTMKVHAHRPITGQVAASMSLTRIGRHWYVNVIVEMSDSPRKRPPTGAMVGIDRGVTSTVATSDGELIANPRHYRRSEARLAQKQQDLARCKRGSKRRRAVATQVAAIHRKIRNQRRDFLHKLSRQLTDQYDLIALEKLNITGMTKSASGTLEEPGTNVAQKSGLNKSILDAGWGILHEMIQYKAEEAGAEVVFVRAADTSRMCNECKHIAQENRNGDAFRCVKCRHEDHADINAAKNILNRGLDASPRYAAA